MSKRKLSPVKVHEESSDEDDFFSKLSKPQAGPYQRPSSRTTSRDNSDEEVNPAVAMLGNKSETNAAVPSQAKMKRHHKESGKRKARMESLLFELEEEKEKLLSASTEDTGNQENAILSYADLDTTTNLFLENLSPSVTAEKLSRVFETFGELYSIKILEPREEVESNRGYRNAFVAFKYRQDAEKAMHTCDGTDIFRVGRRIRLTWGKPFIIEKEDSAPIDRRSTSDSNFLTISDRIRLRTLLKIELSLSRATVCRAMAFVFDHTYAADFITDELHRLFDLDTKANVDTLLARLFLLSDILYNSQQPGIRNASHYRQRIGDIAPDIFEKLGKHGQQCGRLNHDKLTLGVRRVIGAWTTWGAFPSDFLHQLDRRYEGHEVVPLEPASRRSDLSFDKLMQQEPEKTVVSNQLDKEDPTHTTAEKATYPSTAADNPPGKETQNDVEANDDDIDGEPFDEIDGEPLSDIDGEALDGSER